MKRTILVALAITLAASANADDSKPPSTGLSIIAHAGAFWASSSTADFYSGAPQNTNTIDRILHSGLYGYDIWRHLVQERLISPSTIGSYTQLQVVEYPTMSYRSAIQIGLGLHYQYASRMGWLLRFHVTKLEAIGAFNLSSTNETGILGQRQYIRCGILGLEKRSGIDIAITRSIPIQSHISMEIDLGLSMNSTKVEENMIDVGGKQVSILNVWGDRTPDVGSIGYDYINEGGIGYGVFMSLLLGWQTNIGNIMLEYSCQQSRIVLERHTSWGWQHLIGIRLEMNNFSII